MLQMDDLVSIIQAMKTEIRMLKEKNLQHEEYIKKVESKLADALEAKAAAETKAAVAEKSAAALITAASNELDATKVEPDDLSQQQKQLLAAQSEALLQSLPESAAKNGEPKSELLITDVSKDELGTNGYVINVCVTNQVLSQPLTFFHSNNPVNPHKLTLMTLITTIKFLFYFIYRMAVKLVQSRSQPQSIRELQTWKCWVKKQGKKSALRKITLYYLLFSFEFLEIRHW